ncbi:spore coat protein U domain-containing protein [Sphingomonas bacterium]|uniref:spore coat protein U domain-containing protein n=1 Tax=Sphingomonas bacterium TaxID=1895847 RepID=UPI0020C638B3|nr:spore coat protein U domain-containing protein [Sphingomonas bacterium]
MRHFLRLLMLCLGLVLSGPAFAACGVATTVSDDLGSYSSNALKAGAPPYLSEFGGFSCSSASLIALLAGNYLKATVASASVYKMTSATSSDTVSYQLAAAADGSSPLVPGTATYYVNGTALNLLGSGTTSVPIYVKLASSTAVAPGTYTGSVAIRWDWSFCSLIGALNACVGTLDAGSKTATMSFTLTVAPQQTTMLVATTTTWDAISGTTDPKAIPGSRRRASITIGNPDIVAIDRGTLAVILPVANRTIVALDGDGTGSGTVVQTTDGSPASGLTVSYVSPSSTTDNVDFSSDGGTTWSYTPTAGDTASESAVTHIRIRPQGSMAAGSSFKISIPFLVK